MLRNIRPTRFGILLLIVSAGCSSPKDPRQFEENVVVAEKGKVVYFSDFEPVTLSREFRIGETLNRLYERVAELLPIESGEFILDNNFDDASEGAQWTKEDRYLLKNNMLHIPGAGALTLQTELEDERSCVLYIRIKNDFHSQLRIDHADNRSPTERAVPRPDPSHKLNIEPSGGFRDIMIALKKFTKHTTIRLTAFTSQEIYDPYCQPEFLPFKIDRIALYRPSSQQAFDEALRLQHLINYLSCPREGLVAGLPSSFARIGWPYTGLWTANRCFTSQMGLVGSANRFDNRFESTYKVFPLQNSYMGFRLAPLFASTPGRAEFEIRVQFDGTQEVIFSDTAEIGPDSLPDSQEDVPPLRFVDLSSYAGKLVEITFRSEINPPVRDLAFASWIAPVLVTKKQKGTSPAYPSVVWLIADSLRSDAIDPDQRKCGEIPTIDSLFSKGVCFRNFTSASNATTWSVLAAMHSKYLYNLFVGLLPFEGKLGTEDLPRIPAWDDLGRGLMWDYLSRKGYLTVCVTANPFLPPGSIDRSAYMTVFNPKTYSAHKLFQDTLQIMDEWEGYDVPFLNYVHIMDTHSPHIVWPRQIERALENWPDRFDTVSLNVSRLRKSSNSLHRKESERTINNSIDSECDEVEMTSSRGVGSSVYVPIDTAQASHLREGFAITVSFTITPDKDLSIRNFTVAFHENSDGHGDMFYHSIPTTDLVSGQNELFFSSISFEDFGNPAWDTIAATGLHLVSDAPEGVTVTIDSFQILPRFLQKYVQIAAPSSDIGVGPGAFIDWTRTCYSTKIFDLDFELSAFLDGLDQRGFNSETGLFVFSSDHGEQLMEHGHSGHGFDLFQEETRVPGIFVYKPSFPPGQERGDYVGSIDVLPTICDIAGIPLPDSIDGRSIISQQPASLPAVSEAANKPEIALRLEDILCIHNYRDSADSWYTGRGYEEIATEEAEVSTSASESMMSFLQAVPSVVEGATVADTASPVSATEPMMMLPDHDLDRLRQLGYVR